MSDEVKKALEATAFMDGMTIEGNNFKVTQFLSLREHLIASVERCEALEMMIKEHEVDIRKDQDKITRHACAEAVISPSNSRHEDDGIYVEISEAHRICMNVKAV